MSDIKIQKKEGKKWVDDQTIFTVSDELSQAVEDTKDLNSLVGVYIICRDAKEAIKRVTTEWEMPIDALMDRIEGIFKRILDETGQDSAKTASGTVYKTMKSSAKVADWNVLLDYIKKHDAYDLLTKKVADTAVKARMDDTGELVPGVDLVRFIDVNVRRS